MSWVNGRQLASASDGTNTYSYIYDAAGSRIMKNVGTVNHLYFYVNGMLLMEYRYNAMGDTTDVLQYFYDANGRPHAMAYNGTIYLYVTNLQGDIVALLGLDGTVSGYEYDPYGNVIASYGDIAAINPLRYRGYYYDSETGLYYLQSRYYDPVVGRFINADSYASTGQGIIGYNMFAYCNNNPAIFSDASGHAFTSVLQGGIDGKVDFGGSSIAPVAGNGQKQEAKERLGEEISNLMEIWKSKYIQVPMGSRKIHSGWAMISAGFFEIVAPAPTSADEISGLYKIIVGFVKVLSGISKIFD